MNSIKQSKDFYKKLGARGMASLTSPERDFFYVKFLSKLLPKKGKILDCACGYGRLTIPLAKKGFDIEGIDLSSNLIKDARALAKKSKINLKFKIGNMCKLPYQNGSFSFVICMWSSFNHLLTEKDQWNAISEMLRVTAAKGTILIDLPDPKSFTQQQAQAGSFVDKEHRLFKGQIAGFENIEYFHDKKTIKRLLEKFENCSYESSIKSIAGRKRLIVKILKN